jgi:hypothetical protein
MRHFLRDAFRQKRNPSARVTESDSDGLDPLVVRGGGLHARASSITHLHHTTVALPLLRGFSQAMHRGSLSQNFGRWRCDGETLSPSPAWLDWEDRLRVAEC